MAIGRTPSSRWRKIGNAKLYTDFLQAHTEFAAPILDKRPNPVSPEVCARMVQPEDCGDLIRYIACLPKHLVMHEVWLVPAHNRSYIANLQQKL